MVWGALKDLASRYLPTQVAELDPSTIDQILEETLSELPLSDQQSIRKSSYANTILAGLNGLITTFAEHHTDGLDKPESETHFVDDNFFDISLDTDGEFDDARLAIKKLIHKLLQNPEMQAVFEKVLRKSSSKWVAELFEKMFRHGLYTTSIAGINYSIPQVIQSAALANEAFGGNKPLEIKATAAALTGHSLGVAPNIIMASIKQEQARNSSVFAELQNGNAAPLASTIFDQGGRTDSKQTFVETFANRFNLQLPAVKSRQMTIADGQGASLMPALRLITQELIPAKTRKHELEEAPVLTS